MNKWNQKYKEKLNRLEEPQPNQRLKKFTSYLNGGAALELACGLGGNSLLLAGLNYQVQAMDISDVAINYIKDLAAAQGLSINPRVCDLTKGENLKWEGLFDLVVVTYYLDRSLFSSIKKGIKKNGYFFMETYYMSPGNENQGVSVQYKLKPQELLTEFREWKVLFYEENEQEGRQSIFCQKIYH
ncbi:class I SAM-dependent methyltransferase [Neobacillus dielmonensis]|uniref:class I SAM-dependent methyltransferase n=1 Tax=Neobacillus dielmonensis TaxID=1347369 RepID=UPI0018A87484|nr:methyltransferase domain-containing protein [Neobacillus dielmonensis]